MKFLHNTFPNEKDNRGLNSHDHFSNAMVNKNRLTGLANFMNTTLHHAHLSLWAKSRKTNNAKSRKPPKTSI